MFIPIAELVIPTGTQTNEANAEIEMQPTIAKNYLHIFEYFSLIKSYFISSKR